MSNPFVWIGKKIGVAAKDFALAVARIFGLARKVEVILSQEKPLEKPFIAGLVLVIGDIENLLAEGQAAVTDGGLNFPVDSAAYAAFMKLAADSKALVPLVEDQLAILEGKPLPVPVAQIEAGSNALEPSPNPAPQAAQKGPGLDAVTQG